ncbi:MAG: hypothetical protein ACRCYY_10550 [Trueperaceae bacterium]
MDIITLLVSVISALISIYVGFRQNSFNSRLVQLEEKRFERENEEHQKADLRGFSRRMGHIIEIVVENKGIAQAVNISVKLQANNEILSDKNIDKLLSSDSVIVEQIVRDNETPDWAIIEIAWDDLSSQRGSYSRQLKLFHLTDGASDPTPH